MKSLSHAETSVLQTLLGWGENLVTRAAASRRPGHRTGEIAAVVAESGNPSGI
jgi:hypothetical protein